MEKKPAGGWTQPADPSHGSQGYLLTISRRAMACTFTVHLNVASGNRAIEAAMEALDEVERLEGQLSVYRESSEVSAINRLGGILDATRCPDVLPDRPDSGRKRTIEGLIDPVTRMQSASSISGIELVIAPLPNAVTRPATVGECQSRAQ